MNTSTALISTLASTLLCTVACGTADEDSRGQNQGSSPESTTLVVGSAMDFTINKPIINRMWGSSENSVWAVGNAGNGAT